MGGAPLGRRSGASGTRGPLHALVAQFGLPTAVGTLTTERMRGSARVRTFAESPREVWDVLERLRDRSDEHMDPSAPARTVRRQRADGRSEHPAWRRGGVAAWRRSLPCIPGGGALQTPVARPVGAGANAWRDSG